MSRLILLYFKKSLIILKISVDNSVFCAYSLFMLNHKLHIKDQSGNHTSNVVDGFLWTDIKPGYRYRAVQLTLCCPFFLSYQKRKWARPLILRTYSKKMRVSTSLLSSR